MLSTSADDSKMNLEFSTQIRPGKMKKSIFYFIHLKLKKFNLQDISRWLNLYLIEKY